MNWIALGTKLIPYIVMAVDAAERLAGAKKGKEKEDAAIDLLTASVEALEAGLGKDLVDNAKVNRAARVAMAAIVAFQNAVAEAKAAPAA